MVTRPCACGSAHRQVESGFCGTELLCTPRSVLCVNHAAGVVWLPYKVCLRAARCAAPFKTPCHVRHHASWPVALVHNPRASCSGGAGCTARRYAGPSRPAGRGGAGEAGGHCATGGWRGG